MYRIDYAIMLLELLFALLYC